MLSQTLTETGQTNTIYYKVCSFCGETFPAKRVDAKTCKSICRSKLHRWHKKLERERLKAFQAVEEMTSYLKYDLSRPAAAKYLANLDDLIKRTLVENGIKVVR